MALQYAVPLLGQMPLDIKIREYADKGTPLMVSEPTGASAVLYREIARHVTAKLSLQPRDLKMTVPIVNV